MISKTSFVLLALLCACGSGSPGTGSSGVSSSGGPADPVALPGGGTVPSVACGDENVASASGTWDVLSSGGSSGQGTATITIDNSSFVFTQGSRSLAFAASGAGMTLTWSDRGDQVPITVTHRGDAINTGLLPLAVGGQWTFASTTSGGENCTASLAANALNATCDNVRTPSFGRLDGTVVGLRQQQKTSVFGELGGVWHFTGQGSGTVDATVSGNVFTAVVNGSTGPTGGSGWVTVKVCNGTAAGKTSSGFELAATRR